MLKKLDTGPHELNFASHPDGGYHYAVFILCHLFFQFVSDPPKHFNADLVAINKINCDCVLYENTS